MSDLGNRFNENASFSFLQKTKRGIFVKSIS
jgi:hypothetical protein